MLTVIIILCLLYIVYKIMMITNLFESGVGATKLVENISKRQKYNKAKRREYDKLERYRNLTKYFGDLFFSKAVEDKHDYIVTRMAVKSKVLNKTYTASELRGKYIEKLLLGLILVVVSIYTPVNWFSSIIVGILFALYMCNDMTLRIVWGVVIAGVMCVVGHVINPCLVCSLIFITMFSTYQLIYMVQISHEDDIIDKNFCKMFLLMHSQLRLGSKGSLITAVNSYIKALDGVHDKEEQKVMKKFAEYLLNQLSMYPDDMAVPRLKDYYKSATIINFCNVATQALQGIDNRDTLLTYKMEVIKTSNDNMERNADRLCEKGQRNVYLLYVILVFIVLLSWVSKVPTGITSFF